MTPVRPWSKTPFLYCSCFLNKSHMQDKGSLSLQRGREEGVQWLAFLRLCGQHIWPEMFASNSLQGADSSDGVWAYVKTLLGLLFGEPKWGTTQGAAQVWWGVFGRGSACLLFGQNECFYSWLPNAHSALRGVWSMTCGLAASSIASFLCICCLYSLYQRKCS